MDSQDPVLLSICYKYKAHGCEMGGSMTPFVPGIFPSFFIQAIDHWVDYYLDEYQSESLDWGRGPKPEYFMPTDSIQVW